MSGIDPAVNGLLQKINTPAAVPHVCPSWAEMRWAALRRALIDIRDQEQAMAAKHPDGSAPGQADAMRRVLVMMDEVEHIIEEPA